MAFFTQDELVDVAASLGVRYLGPLRGGMFGACRVEGDDGRIQVLKAWPLPQYAADWERGARTANLMRARGYPAPAYAGAGSFEGGCWSRQEFLPGAVPAPATPAHLERLLALVRTHAGAADQPAAPAEPLARLRAGLEVAVRTLRARPEAAVLAEELAQLASRSTGLSLRRGDVVHGDFHPGNVLVDGDDVVGVFDWEGAGAGDWRYDLANLVVTTHSDACDAALRQAAPPEVAALLVGWHCARYLAFDANEQPQLLEANAVRVEGELARWWRD